MNQYCALLSIVLMMSVVMMFDKVHYKRVFTRFWNMGLLSGDEIDQIRRVLEACEEG
jgi:hypothetical protein